MTKVTMTNLNTDAYRHQLLCGLADGFNALTMGTTLGYTSSALVLMDQDPTFYITEEQGSWIGAVVPGMALIGSLAAGPLVESYGSRFVLLATFLPGLLTWLSIATASSSYSVILARSVSGMLLGLQQVGISVFLSETVTPHLRPVCGIFPAVLAAMGFLVMNLPATLVTWRGLAYVGSILSIPLFLIVFYLPNSPYFLLKKGKKEMALINFKWLRGSESDAQKEFKELQSACLEGRSKEPSFAEMFQPPNRWPLCVSLLLFIFQQFAGISALTSFMGLVLERAGSAVDASTCSLIMTVINIVIVVYASRLFVRYPRILFIKYSSLFIAISLSLLSLYLWIKDSSGILQEISSYLNFIPLLSYIVYVVAFSMGWGPIPWMFMGDGLPLKIRGKGASLGVAVCWFFNFMVTKSFSWGMFYFGMWAVILLYVVLTLIGWLVMTVYLPETFGFSPSQLDKFYSNSYRKKEKLN